MMSISAGVMSRWRSAHASSVANPDDIESSWPIVIGGEPSGLRTAASSRAWSATGSSSDQAPSSRSHSTIAAVKLFVIEAMRYTVSVASPSVSTPFSITPQAIEAQRSSCAVVATSSRITAPRGSRP